MIIQYPITKLEALDTNSEIIYGEIFKSEVSRNVSDQWQLLFQLGNQHLFGRNTYIIRLNQGQSLKPTP